MSPAEFVTKMLSEGKSDVIIGMLEQFYSSRVMTMAPESYLFKRFAAAFVIRTMNQLARLEKGGTVYDDPLLTVWGDMAYFGIEWSEVHRYNVANAVPAENEIQGGSDPTHGTDVQ